jgi:hypothetical protein
MSENDSHSTWTHLVELHGIACVHFMLGVREGDELVTAAHFEVQNSLLLTAHTIKVDQPDRQFY